MLQQAHLPTQVAGTLQRALRLFRVSAGELDGGAAQAA